MKYFVVSDVHGFFDEMKSVLDANGFDRLNSEHTLVICGDLLDRGSQPKELLTYLRTCPQKVLIRGNHEDLFVECCCRKEFYMHDISNGTADTIMTLAGCDDILKMTDYDYTKAYSVFVPFLTQMVNYFETEHYIFVHGWLPEVPEGFADVGLKSWRDYPQNCSAWEEARWRNGMLAAMNGEIEKDKTIICGHWHSSWGHARFDDPPAAEWGNEADFTPYYNKGIIAIDACTAYSGFVNCLVLED